MNVVKVQAEKRTEVGTKSSKSLRREGKIPCVLYGNDQVEYFTVEFNQVKGLVYTPEFKLAEIEIDGTVHKCILKDIQMHPVTDAIVHIDFLRLVDDVKVKVELPIAFKGDSPGVKNGGKLIQTMRTIKIKTTPDKLVDKLYVSIQGLKLGNSVRVKDVEVGEGVEVMSALATPVAQVAIPRALKSAGAIGDLDLDEEEETAETAEEA
ncbi:50S ribosomal protein L25 [Portibacter lacus]|uniref:Large ribosomal subunit protein bL25 n=1 Tax=Portibacter lacus TaxID=1099794 RepID=A0AA37SR57_9BACT|nr:50S ribosomal protein L25 [Portibacter lacus]GLR19178.1 50S ribosomal protein L25 [Portibacter lacus]